MREAAKQFEFEKAAKTPRHHQRTPHRRIPVCLERAKKFISMCSKHTELGAQIIIEFKRIGGSARFNELFPDRKQTHQGMRG